MAKAPEEIGARRAANGAARVLRQHQARERNIRERLGRGQKNGRAERYVTRVDGNAPARRQRYAQSALRPCGGGAVFTVCRHFAGAQV